MASKIFVISMVSAVERRARFEADAAHAGLPWRFFDAHTALQPPLRHDPARAEAAIGRALLPGELGCYSSHAALWRRLADDPEADQYIILEDDVVVDWAALALVHGRRIADDDYAYLRLFHKHPSRRIVRRRDYLRSGLFVLELTDKAFGTQGYALTKQAAARFLAAGSEVIRPVDDLMDRYWEHGVANLALFPALLFERTVASSIRDDTRKPVPTRTWRRRLGLLRDRNRRRLATLRARLRRAR